MHIEHVPLTLKMAKQGVEFTTLTAIWKYVLKYNYWGIYCMSAVTLATQFAL